MSLAFWFGAGGVRADYVPSVVTGEHWTKSSPETMKVYLICAQSLFPRLVKGLRGQTLWFEVVFPGLKKPKPGKTTMLRGGLLAASAASSPGMPRLSV